MIQRVVGEGTAYARVIMICEHRKIDRESILASKTSQCVLCACFVVSVHLGEQLIRYDTRYNTFKGLLV